MSARKKKRGVPKAQSITTKPPPVFPKDYLPAPFGWPVSKWTEIARHVPPCSTEAGKHLCRVRRDELIAAGALVRVGRELTIMGGPYARWLQSEAHRKAVNNYQIAANGKREDLP